MESLSVLHFTEDGKFWGSTKKEIEWLSNVEPPVGEGNAEYKQLENFVQEGAMCFVNHGHTWKRGKIVSLLTGQLGTQAEVFLIDRALQISTSIRSCYSLPVGIAKIPPLANLYSLKGVQPCKGDSGKWSEQVMEFLNKLNGGPTLEAELDSGNTATLYWHAGDVRMNFNECLLHASLATTRRVVLDDFVDTAVNSEEIVVELKNNPSQHAVQDVLVESALQLSPWISLQVSKFPVTVQKGLLSLGFKTPTSVQACAWPFIWEGYNTVMVSTSGTGKTLCYLLPIFADVSTFTESQGPQVLVVVGTSWQARSSHIQAKRILSWISAREPLRCCCTYLGIEAQATVDLINGADVVIGTPPSILRLLANGALTLKHVLKLVLDDSTELFKQFKDDLHIVLSQCASASVNQIVVTASEWSPIVHSLVTAYITNPVFITSVIEALVKTQTSVRVIPCDQENRVASMIDNLSGRSVVVCTSSPEEATEIQQVAQLNSWPCINILSNEECTQVNLARPSSGIVVISDSLLEVVLQNQLLVGHLLHYTLPQSKVLFRRRLALLFPSLSRGEQCQCTVLVTDQDRARSLLLVDLLERTQQLVPEPLQNMAEDFKKERDERRCSFDVCYHLKAWGNCSVDKCPSVHKLVHISGQRDRPPSLCLPFSGVVEVKVCHVSNATRLWVSVLKHYPKGRGGETVPGNKPSDLVSLSLHLTQYYSEFQNRVLEEEIHEGVYCALEDVDGSYYRARVLKFSNPLGFCFPHKEKARVRLIDHGRVRIVDLNQLLVLPDDFLDLPPQVAEVILCGAKPGETDLDWCEESIKLSQSILEGETIVGQIALRLGQTLWLDPVECRVSLHGIKVNTALYNPVSELVKAGFAVRNTNHLQSLKVNLGISSTPEQMPIERVSKLLLADDEETEVCVSAVSTPSLLYIQIVKNQAQLQELEKMLNSTDLLMLSAPSFVEGELCSAQFPMDDRWYRGRVREVGLDKTDVFFIDHGDTEWIPSDKIQPIDLAMLDLPAQAIQCSLTECEESWCDESYGDTLWDLSRGSNFRAKVLETLEDGTYLLTLIDTDADSCLLDDLISKTKSQPQPTGLISEVVGGILAKETDRVRIVKILESLMVNDPKYVVNYLHELTPLLAKVQQVDGNTVLHVLRGISSSRELLLASLEEGDWILDLLTSHNIEVLTATLQIAKLSFSSCRPHYQSRVAHCVHSLLKSEELPVTAVKCVLDILLLAGKDSVFTLDTVFLADLGCKHALSGDASLSCLQLLDLLSLNEISASIMRSMLSVNTLITCNGIRKYLEALDHGGVLVSILWNLSSNSNYLNQLRCCSWWESSNCHLVISALIKQKFKLRVDSLPHKKDVKDLRTITARRKVLICPQVLWSQRESSLLLAVQLRDCHSDDVQVSFRPRDVLFRAQNNGHSYGFDVCLQANICTQHCGFVLTASEVLISLNKETMGHWSSLTNKGNRIPMFTVDFDRCETAFSDEECVDNKNSFVRESHREQCDDQNADEGSESEAEWHEDNYFDFF